MNVDRVRKMTNRAISLYWIRERESIRLRRRDGVLRADWTDDEVLQNYRFCNVVRMDDRVSQWLWNNWYQPNIGHPNMVTAITLARHINDTEILAELGFPNRWNADNCARKLHARRERGLTCFSSAYIINGTKGMYKVDSVVYNVVDTVHKMRKRVPTNSIYDCVQCLSTVTGLGSFLSGQIAADMRQCIEGEWADRMYYHTRGPGSCRGINLFHGRDPFASINNNTWQIWLPEYIDFCKERLPVVLTERMEAIDYQNCLCELSKYKAGLEGRRLKRRYR